MRTDAARDEYPYSGYHTPHTASYLWPAVEGALAGHERILDLGCGTGAFTARLAFLGHQVVGVDSSTSGIAEARRAHPNAEFVAASVYDDLSRLGLFDAAVALEVIEHCYYPRRLVRSMLGAVRPGGRIVVTTPYHGYLKNLVIALSGRCDAHYSPLWDHGHIKFFSERTLRALLAEEGVRRLTVLRAGRIPPIAKSMIGLGYR